LTSCIVTKIDPNRYEVTYIPDRVGEFHIEIFYDNIPIDNSPFISRSFDVNKIKIHDFPKSTIVDSPTYFLSKYYIIEFIYEILFFFVNI